MPSAQIALFCHSSRKCMKIHRHCSHSDMYSFGNIFQNQIVPQLGRYQTISVSNETLSRIQTCKNLNCFHHQLIYRSILVIFSTFDRNSFIRVDRKLS